MEPCFSRRVRSHGYAEHVLVDLFTRELDHWGDENASDPFLFAVVAAAPKLRCEQLRTLLDTFGTLDELLAMSRRELLALKGIGRATVKALEDELFMRGLELPAEGLA